MWTSILITIYILTLTMISSSSSTTSTASTTWSTSASTASASLAQMSKHLKGHFIRHNCLSDDMSDGGFRVTCIKDFSQTIEIRRERVNNNDVTINCATPFYLDSGNETGTNLVNYLSEKPVQKLVVQSCSLKIFDNWLWLTSNYVIIYPTILSGVNVISNTLNFEMWCLIRCQFYQHLTRSFFTWKCFAQLFSNYILT